MAMATATATETATETDTAYPGQILAPLSTHDPGAGTHVYESNIYASIAGFVTRSSIDGNTKSRPSISISQTRNDTISNETSPKLPQVGSIVLGRVLRVQRLQLTISVIMVDPSSAADIQLYTSMTNDELQPQAILRKEDVRAYEKDKIVMNDSFRTGDIVRAVVISLGDERNYYVSTAGNENGVVVARSTDGNVLVPVSWKEMRDVVTGKAEARKVAKTV